MTKEKKAEERDKNRLRMVEVRKRKQSSSPPVCPSPKEACPVRMVADSPIKVVAASASPVEMVASPTVEVDLSKAIKFTLKPPPKKKKSTTSLQNKVVDFSRYFVPSNKST